MKYDLDFNIYFSKDRCKYLKKINLEELSPKDLETCANYVLYGKDEDDTSIVDRKEIQIKTKFSSYSKKEPLSLDSILESPTFNEGSLKTEKNIYKKVKPTIDKEKASNVKGMKELWNEIDNLQRVLDENTEKLPKTSTTPYLSQKQIYYLKHQIIAMRRQQYYLMDSAYPVVGTAATANRNQYFTEVSSTHLNYPVFPRGLFREPNDQDFKFPRQDSKKLKATDIDQRILELKKKNKFFIDFRNKDHIYQLILFYWDIKLAVEKIPDSILNNLLWTLDFYIEKANLSKQQKFIVEDKKLRLPNKTIAAHLKEELNIEHQENYISTIWNKTTQLIAAAAELNYDEWLCKDYDKGWKTCNSCGKEFLRDPRCFVRKSKAADGLTSCCKRCDKLKRTGGF